MKCLMLEGTNRGWSGRSMGGDRKGRSKIEREKNRGEVVYWERK